jgi:hypothetical protein
VGQMCGRHWILACLFSRGVLLAFKISQKLALRKIISWLLSERHLCTISIKKVTERWRTTLYHSLILNGLSVKRADSYYSTAWPRGQASLWVFKKQTPRHPSPHTQSSAVNNTQLLHGHSLCQILQGRESVRMSRYCNCQRSLTLLLR